MPDNDLDSLVDSMAGGADEFDSLVDSMAAPQAPAAPKTPAKFQPSATAEAAGRGLDAPLKDQRSWWQKLTDQAENFSALPDGTYQDPQNLTLEEAARAADANGLTGPEALRRLSEAVVLANAPAPFKGAGALPRLGNAAVSGGYQGGLTSLDQGNDLEQVAEDTATGAAVGGALQGLGEAGASAGKALLNSANKLRTHIFMTPAQRHAYKAAKGPDALAKLGSDARDAGLFKGGLGPATAGRVEANADRVMAEAGGNIGQFEDDIAKQGLDVNVDYRPVADRLRSDAEFMANRSGTSAQKHAAEIQAEADALQPTETARRWLPREMPAEQMSLDLPPGEISNRAMPASAPALPEQMSLPGTESAPRQLGLDFGPAPAAPAAAPAPAQQMSLPLREPEQMSLRLPETSQGSLQFGGADVPRNLPPQTELADQTAGSLVRMRQGQQPQLANDPAWDAAVAPPAAESREAQQLLMPGADQMSLPGTSATPRGVTVPEAPAVPPAPAQQMSMPAQQSDMFPASRPDGVTQWSPGSLEGEQNALRLGQPERFEDLTRPRPGRPFQEAIADKRNYANEIKWNKNAQTASMGQDAAKKAAWSGLSDQIDSALDAAVARGEIVPEALAAYRENMKNFSTAATVHDPAMRMAERQGQIGLGAADMLAATAAGDPGVAVVSRAGRGRGAAMGAAITENLAAGATRGGQAAQAAARAVPAINQALQANPGGSKSDIEREANSDTKTQLKGWWTYLTGQ